MLVETTLSAEVVTAETNTDTIGIVIIDDHAMLLEGLAMALGRQPDIEILGTATDRTTGFDRFCLLEPDVLVVDYRIGAETGADLARDVMRRNPEAAVVVMSALDNAVVLGDVIRAGCMGFVDKRRGVEALAFAVRAASVGSVHFPRRAMDGFPSGPTPLEHDLTTRELEILERLGRAESSIAIARALNVSVHTVRNHTREVRRKLGVQTQLAAVVEGIRRGLIPSPRTD